MPPMHGYPMMMPPFVIQQDAGRNEPQHVPARVRVAMSALEYCTRKTAETAAGNDISIITLDGQKLDVEEVEMLRVSAKTIIGYLQGSFALTDDERKDERAKLQKKMTYIRCPNCGGQTRMGHRCVMCKGAGNIVYRPAMDDESPDNDEEKT